MKLSITQKCACLNVCVCVWGRYVSEGDCLGGDACVFYQTLLAFELLAAASDSVSSSPFIRSASRRCHLSFPCAYITLAHTPSRTRSRATIGSRAPRGRSGWLAGPCSVRPGRERASRTTFHLKSQCEYANWSVDWYERRIWMSVCCWHIHRWY